MTNWQPELESRSGPRYVAIAEALAEDIDQGRLAAGERLPTHRDLAWRLGVTVGTVSRAYAEAERRGLIAGEVGRGTFIRERVPVDLPAQAETDGDFIDLSFNFMQGHTEDPALREALAELSRDPALDRVLGYEMGLGQATHRAAGAAWLGEMGLAAEAGEIAVTAGAQHAMQLAVSAVTRPGDVIMTEELTYYGIKSIAAHRELRLHGLAMDEFGIQPEALDAACRGTGAKTLYCIPTLQNPTASVMPEARRREIAEICKRHGVYVIEDDIYGFLPTEAPPPLTSHLPESGIYLTSLSKCVAPALRVGFLRCDAALLDRIGEALRATSLMASPLTAEAAARLIRDGRARRIALRQRREAEARQQRAAETLPAGSYDSHPQAYHLWLKLPEPWRREIFATEARVRGVGIAPAEVFAVGRQPVPHAVRVCLQSARSRDKAARALEILAGILARPPASAFPLV
ncbi:MAG: PLP-dependent aminotransferase family protein [Rhodospirillales bacterium]|nr:PLP-dependent aminotransferase family protein [Rhodospirillales bacterium]